jgi:Flp pilus assembly protein TadD
MQSEDHHRLPEPLTSELLHRAFSLHQQGQMVDAAHLYEQILAREPSNFDALHLLGLTAHQSGDHQRAVDLISAALSIDRTQPDACTNLGLALRGLGRYSEALAFADAAIALRPRSSSGHSNRGNILRDMKRLPEALASLDQAVAIDPSDAVAQCNRGNVLQDLGRLEEALTCFDRAIALQPDLAVAKFNKALALLLTGRFEEGWPLYESRVVQGRLSLPQPPWLGGKEIGGRTVLLHSEQGLGDTLQFCRYANLVKDKQARVVLRVPASLAGLVATLQGVDAVVSEFDALPEFDEHCPLPSLPLAFGTRLDSIPGPSPYLFSRPERREFWSRRLGEKGGLRVGLAWSGTWCATHGYNRSIPLEELLRHLPAGPTYVCLQKDVRAIDQAALDSSDIRDLRDEIRDFEDTAALCDLMDLVISIDTSVAHLAGALGRPTWVLLACVPDWRWLLDREDCPWYPTARLYRQPEPGKWSPILEQAAADLSRLG